jgi:hypothetical protein
LRTSWARGRERVVEGGRGQPRPPSTVFYRLQQHFTEL